MRTINNRRTAAVLSASALVLGLIAISQPALAGISNTRHNLGSGTITAGVTAGRAQLSAASGGTTEICVFCHTPHGAAVTTAPLWNKVLSKTATSYTSYTSATSITFDAQQDGPGPSSLGCLSCHDGTQAMDNILNLPGYGTSLFATATGGMTGASWTWINGPTTEGFMDSSTTLMLGTNLSNDHPIGMNYCADNTPTGTGSCEGSTESPAEYRAMSGTASRRYVNTDIGGTTFTKTDFPLYSNGAITTKVECATCHDPHTENSQFLRMAGGNAGSQVCLACHTGK